MRNLKATAEKGKGDTPNVRRITSAGTQVRVPGVPGASTKAPGITKDAARGLGIKR